MPNESKEKTKEAIGPKRDNIVALLSKHQADSSIHSAISIHWEC